MKCATPTDSGELDHRFRGERDERSWLRRHRLAVFGNDDRHLPRRAPPNVSGFAIHFRLLKQHVGFDPPGAALGFTADAPMVPTCLRCERVRSGYRQGRRITVARCPGVPERVRPKCARDLSEGLLFVASRGYLGSIGARRRCGHRGHSLAPAHARKVVARSPAHRHEGARPGRLVPGSMLSEIHHCGTTEHPP